MVKPRSVSSEGMVKAATRPNVKSLGREGAGARGRAAREEHAQGTLAEHSQARPEDGLPLTDWLLRDAQPMDISNSPHCNRSTTRDWTRTPETLEKYRPGNPGSNFRLL